MAQALNETKGIMVADEVRMARSWWARFRGLMLRKSLPEGHGLLIDPCSSIHCMFMRFPIDVIFLDADGVVTKVAVSVKPWWGAALGGGGRKALEVASGAAARAQVEAGDRIVISGE